MKIHHVEFLPEFIRPIKEGKKTETRRPLKFQPDLVAADHLLFSEGLEHYKIYRSDFPCAFGEPGDLIFCCVEGNPIFFHTAKVSNNDVERLMDCAENEGWRREGYQDFAQFIASWDGIYGETPFASHFNPYVWVVRWQ